MTKQYNGWTNFETWCVNLWLENDPGEHHYWREQAHAIAKNAPQSQQAREKTQSIEQFARFTLAEQLKAEWTERNPLGKPDVFSDLLGAALAEVDWQEIAEHLLIDLLPTAAGGCTQPPAAEPQPPEEELFSPGRVLGTPGALQALTQDEISVALNRHLRGDWGLLCPEDQAENQLALSQGFRLLSAYDSPAGTRFWIITEADRSVTTVLLPSEY